MLLNEPQTETAQTILTLMRGSVLRMSILIDNVMDFARGRLGGGIGLELVSGKPLNVTLQQVVAEILSAHPERRFETDIDVPDDLRVDHGRIGQMLSNMLGNAVTHGAADQPVRISAFVKDRVLRISVANGGNPIPDAARALLFQPFSRGEAGTSQQGLGLGLYIASQIAEAHEGRLEVNSDGRETKFTFTMPTEPVR